MWRDWIRLGTKVILLTAICLPAFSQALYHGVVVNQDRQPLPYVSVSIKHKGVGTYSDSLGRFRIKVSSNDTITLTTVGCLPREYARELMSDTLRLDQQAIQLPTVSILSKAKISPHGFHKNKRTGLLQNVRAVALHIKNPQRKRGTVSQAVFKLERFITTENQPFKIRVRVYLIGDDKSPGVDVLTENVIFQVASGERELKVHLEKYEISFPEDGLFVGLDFLGTTDTKGTFIPFDSDKMASENFASSFSGNHNEALSFFRTESIDWKQLAFPDKHGKFHNLNFGILVVEDAAD